MGSQRVRHDLATEQQQQRWSSGKESVCQCRRRGFDPCVRKIFWRRKWQPISVFLPEKSHGWRSLAGYSSWGCKSRTCTALLPTWVDFFFIWQPLIFPVHFWTILATLLQVPPLHLSNTFYSLLPWWCLFQWRQYLENSSSCEFMAVFKPPMWWLVIPCTL